jgi:hypothetical protein
MRRRGIQIAILAVALAAAIGGLQSTRWAPPAWLTGSALIICFAVALYGVVLIVTNAAPGSPKGGLAMQANQEHGGWEPVGESGRFQRISLPMSMEAIDLNQHRQRSLLYGEFDTGLESAAWAAFLYDPLRVLVAEGILEGSDGSPAHLQIEISKLTGSEDYESEYLERIQARGDTSAELYQGTEVPEGLRGSWRVSTTVANHEYPLNPRIGMTTIWM